MIDDKINLIRDANISDLKNSAFLEHIICELGLFPKSQKALEQFPKSLHQYCNKGLRIWQYPNQLADLAIKLSKYKINSYLEIGCAAGGTLIFLHEYIKRFNSIKSIGIEVSIRGNQGKESLSDCNDIKIIIMHSNKYMRNLDKNINFDLIMIDADHSYSAVKNDWNNVSNRCKAVIFHDIVNQSCKGTVKFWKEFKSKYSDTYDIYEYNQQYEEVLQRTKMTFLGIGLAIKKGAFDV